MRDMETRQEQKDETGHRQDAMWEKRDRGSAAYNSTVVLQKSLAVHTALIERLRLTRDWSLRVGLMECWLSLPICPVCGYPTVTLESGVTWQFGFRYHWIGTTGSVYCRERKHREGYSQ